MQSRAGRAAGCKNQDETRLASESGQPLARLVRLVLPASR